MGAGLGAAGLGAAGLGAAGLGAAGLGAADLGAADLGAAGLRGAALRLAFLAAGFRAALFFAATFFFFLAGAAFLPLLVFLVFDFAFFAMIVLLIVSAPVRMGTNSAATPAIGTSHALPVSSPLRQDSLTCRSTGSSSAPPALGPRSPSRSARLD